MKRVALTGGIATGKSVVGAEFERLGVPTIDADVVARDVVAPDSPALAAIRARFGDGVVDQERRLDRRKLGSIVFADPAAREDLERIVHPAVRAAVDAWFAGLDAAGHPMAIAIIPLLYETGRERDFDVVVATACSPETQLRRVITRDLLTEDEARQRIAAQLPTDAKVRRADHVIWTDGARDDTSRQVRSVLAELRA